MEAFKAEAVLFLEVKPDSFGKNRENGDFSPLLH